jgi:hypothetical protein
VLVVDRGEIALMTQGGAETGQCGNGYCAGGKSCIDELDICIGGIQGRDVTEAGKMETSEVVELTWLLRSS